MGKNVGQGLAYSPATHQLSARLSSDSGNALTFGSDGGLFGSGGGGPAPVACRKSVAGLPATGVVGAESLAGFLHPFNSPYGLDYCLQHDIDMVHVQVAATVDGAAWLAEGSDGEVSEGRSSLYKTEPARRLQSDTITSTLNFAGDVDDPKWLLSPPDRNTRGGGWYGWLAPRYQNWLLPEFLQRLDGKAVAFVSCTASGAPATETSNLTAALRAVRQKCAQPWTMLAIQDLANATTVLNAGVAACLTPGRPTWGTTDLPYPVADVQTAGVKWIALSMYYADSVFATYRDAGINVLATGVSRHFHRQRFEALNIRGALSGDPVYYRGPSTYDYRSNIADPWAQRRPALGQLTLLTDQNMVLGDRKRGFPKKSQEGIFIENDWGGGLGLPSVLCGWRCPLPKSDTYSIEVDIMFDTLPESGGGGKMALLFGAATDQDTFQWTPEYQLPPGNMSMYRAWQRHTGQIGIGKWHETTGEWNVLAELDTPAVAVGVWNTYQLDVTPARVTWTRKTIDSGPYTIFTEDTTYRGPYFFCEKEELTAQFQGGFRRVRYYPGGIA
ncbi:hypothetical protein [Streptomyces sp. TR02-1]|uniref:hypothetical protein n=1 Tax=Streptomyces sp. TR02-1 TaxID=3385977 RepID=UPI0039A003A1